MPRGWRTGRKTSVALLSASRGSLLIQVRPWRFRWLAFAAVFFFFMFLASNMSLVTAYGFAFFSGSESGPDSGGAFGTPPDEFLDVF